MKVYALNASPRKNWNSDEMLDAFIKGVSETNPDLHIVLRRKPAVAHPLLLQRVHRVSLLQECVTNV